MYGSQKNRPEYTKRGILDNIFGVAKDYKKYLAYSSLLIIYKDKISNKIEGIEVYFHPDKYQHLTGIDLLDKNGIKREHVAMEFYRRCLGVPYITEAELSYDVNENYYKMNALPYLSNITGITKMTGEYDERLKDKLKADYIIGGTNCCIAIEKYKDKNVYYPKSSLSEDIRNITKYSSQVLAIFQKFDSEGGNIFSNVKYVAKGTNLFALNYSKELKEKISLENYQYNGSISKKNKKNKKKNKSPQAEAKNIEIDEVDLDEI